MAWLEGDLFLASEAGAYFLDIDDELRPFPIPYSNNATVYKFMYDPEGSLWVSTKGRLLYRDSSGNWQRIEPSDLEETIWFSDIFVDKNNNIWLVSLTEGLWQASPSQVNRYRDGEELNQEPRILLSTIHGVKGGEADNVVLLTDLSKNTQSNYERYPDDENRLFYVGATRTKNHLHIVRPKDIYKSYRI